MEMWFEDLKKNTWMDAVFVKIIGVGRTKSK